MEMLTFVGADASFSNYEGRVPGLPLVDLVGTRLKGWSGSQK